MRSTSSRGETKWITSAGDPIEHEPLVARDDIFIISKAGRFISVDAETGTQKWSVQSRSEGAQILAIGEKRIYARSGCRWSGDRRSRDRTDPATRTTRAASTCASSRQT